ncbi:hypothetical protein Dda_1916 [Drechslerella dactyloides]|uniref:Uncharacterized protein n=1 Tax=Drechslerella dactyloides TaxID=74499 RepID=A0AAD6J2J6_DREDA|nr:hypothetical protein Dda_1916 [Drechslerella dactyloides]
MPDSKSKPDPCAPLQQLGASPNPPTISNETPPSASRLNPRHRPTINVFLSAALREHAGPHGFPLITELNRREREKRTKRRRRRPISRHPMVRRPIPPSHTPDGNPIMPAWGADVLDPREHLPKLREMLESGEVPDYHRTNLEAVISDLENGIQPWDWYQEGQPVELEDIDFDKPLWKANSIRFTTFMVNATSPRTSHSNLNLIKSHHPPMTIGALNDTGRKDPTTCGGS